MSLVLGDDVVELDKHADQVAISLGASLLEETRDGHIEEAEIRFSEVGVGYSLVKSVEEVRQGNTIATDLPAISEEPPPRAIRGVCLSHSHFHETVMDQPTVDGLLGHDSLSSWLSSGWVYLAAMVVMMASMFFT
jgi:hypothetical protein